MALLSKWKAAPQEGSQKCRVPGKTWLSLLGERCEGQVWEKTSSAKLSEEVCRRNEGGDVERGADVDIRSLTKRLWRWWKPGEAAGWLLWRLKKSSKNLDAEPEDLLHHRQSQERQRWRQTDGAAANHRWASSVCSLLFFPPPQNYHNVLFSASGLSGSLKMTLLLGLVDV